MELILSKEEKKNNLSVRVEVHKYDNMDEYLNHSNMWMKAGFAQSILYKIKDSIYVTYTRIIELCKED